MNHIVDAINGEKPAMRWLLKVAAVCPEPPHIPVADWSRNRSAAGRLMYDIRNHGRADYLLPLRHFQPM